MVLMGIMWLVPESLGLRLPQATRLQYGHSQCICTG